MGHFWVEINSEWANPHAWEVKTWTFTTRTDCDTLNTNYSVSLRNLSAQNSGNDFYVDDIKLEKIASPTDPILCAKPPKNSIDAQDDNWTSTTTGGKVGSLLDDDTTDGVPSSPANTTLTVLDNPGNLTVDPSSGDVNVPANTPAGDYEIRYQICVAPATTPWPTCDEAVAKITVTTTPPAITIKASDDDFTSTPITVGSGSTTKTGSVLDNDKLNGNPVDAQNSVVVSKHPDPLNEPPTGIKINADGTLEVDASVPTGTYFVHYQICAPSGSVCDTAIAKIAVNNTTPPEIDAKDDDFTTSTTIVPGGKTPSVLGNDSVGSTTNPVSKTDVTVQKDPQNPPPTGWVVNDDGTITVDPAATPGDYPVAYQICTTTTPVKCDTATATVRITSPSTTPLPTPIVANDDDLSSTPVEPGQSTSVITGNDTLGGVPVTPGVDVTVGEDPDNAPPVGFQIKTDGTITVDSTVTPGWYEVPYQICEKDTTNCATATVTVAVMDTSSGGGDGSNSGNNGGTTPTTPTTATPVPGLQTWSLALLSLMLGGAALRRRTRD